MTMERGTRSRLSTLSESITVRSSNSTVDGRAGRVPVAMTMFSAVTSTSRPDGSSTATVWSSVKRPVPVSMVTRLRES